MSHGSRAPYMARKGVAKGKPGQDPSADRREAGQVPLRLRPLCRAGAAHQARRPGRGRDPGRIRGRDQERERHPSKLLNVPFLNPQCGPIAVEGAEKGDVLCVHIHSIKPRGPQPVGTTALITEFGGLVATNNTALLNPPLPERVKKMEVTEQGIKFNSKITLPYEPFIGTLGVSPQIEAVTSLQPDYWGGNMDLPDVCPGAVVYFPVHHKDAYLYLGDCHATQGDGELCGVAVEIPSTTTVQVDLIKKWQIAWPRLENERFIMTIGSTRPMEDAARIAYRELIRWLVSRLRLRRDRGLFPFDPGRPGPARQHGRPEIHPGRVAAEVVSGLKSGIQLEGAWISDCGACARSSPAAPRASAAAPPTCSPRKVRNVAICARNDADVKAAVARLEKKGVQRYGEALRRLRQGRARSLGRELGQGARRDRHRRRQCLGAGRAATTRRPGASVRDRHDAHRAHGERGHAPSREEQASVDHHRLERLGPRDRFHRAGLRRVQGGAGPLRPRARLSARRQGHPGQRGLARQHLFRGRDLGPDRAEQPGALQAGAGAQPDRPHGDRRGDRPRHRVPGEPGVELHDRHQPGDRRRADPGVQL